MSSGLCPCGWIHTKGSEWRCAKYLEHQHAITENKNDIPNNPNNKNDPKSINNKNKNDHPTKEPAMRRQRTQERLRKRRYRQTSHAKRLAKRQRYDPRVKWGRFRSQAKYRGIEVTLTQEQHTAIVRGPCTHCRDFHSTRLRGVDRTDSDGVYSPDNSVPCCATCNFMKGSLSAEEFLDKANAIVHTHETSKRTTQQRDRTL